MHHGFLLTVGLAPEGVKYERISNKQAVFFGPYLSHMTRSTWGQFHQPSTRSFYVCKLRTQLFCAYILGLYFTSISLPAQ
jgi:hypothetical protein